MKITGHTAEAIRGPVMEHRIKAQFLLIEIESDGLVCVRASERERL